MIDRKLILADLQTLLRKEVEPDLRKRSELPAIAAALKAEFDKAKKAKRTAMNYTDWRADMITQIGVAWVLSCVFIRFLEDNRMVDPPRLSGPTAADGDSQSALQRARDEYDLHIKANPEHSFRQYILSVIDDLSKLSGGKEVFGKNNIIHQHRDWLSNDAAKRLYNFWQTIEPATGELVHDFTDDADEGEPFDTRFLGDLYQDLSEAARKKYALLQTPDFVEEFILDRTLEPALDEFGLEPKPPEGSGLTTNTFRMIDPACGSGHFLLGAFDRILERWQRKEPGTKIDVLVDRTLASIHGVDVNPFAVAIAKFRLLLAAFRACHVTRLNQPIDFHVNVACGDSLYHGKQQQMLLDGMETDESHYFKAEDAENLRRILQEGTFHVVVANPPYITVKDKAANQAYRNLYSTCHRKYSLAVPFMECIFRLAIRTDSNVRVGAGYTGQITANSFMKREFGKKLIEEFFATIDLTHIIDTSGAYIPGHGTPTVVLFGKNVTPATKTIRTVMGIKGEPSTPKTPSQGIVWSGIVNEIDTPGFQGTFITVGDVPRESLRTHPWSLVGGGGAELKQLLDSHAVETLGERIASIGFFAIPGDEDAYAFRNESDVRRLRFSKKTTKNYVLGNDVRNWAAVPSCFCIFPYDSNAVFQADKSTDAHFWMYSSVLKNTLYFGKKKYERGMDWREWVIVFPERIRDQRSILFPNVSTHNNFAFDNQSNTFADPVRVIKLHEESSDSVFFEMISLLNSSVGCYWMKQVFHNKGDSTDQHGARTTGEVEFNTYQFDGTKLKKFPVVKSNLACIASRVHEIAANTATLLPRAVCENDPTDVRNGRRFVEEKQWEMIALQEEIDWACYRAYGLVEEDLTYSGKLPRVEFGLRAFERLLTARIANGDVVSQWFSRHGREPVKQLPEDWPDDYKQLVQRRIDIIESNRQIALIEQPEYKRRWNTESWDSQVNRALREWMLLRLESYFDFDGRMNDDVQPTSKFDIGVTSVAKLADVAIKDAQFKEVAEVYRGRADFDPVKLIDELVADEHVPALPFLRYKPAGVDKRAEWENTWRLQRIEDQIHAEVERTCRDALTEESAAAVTPEQPLDPYKAKLNVNKVDFNKLVEVMSNFELTAVAAGVNARSEPVAKTVDSLKKGFTKSKFGTLVDLQRLVTHEILGDIPVPSKYASSDFISTGGAKYWNLRGKLDVPKERWVSFPHCQGEDQTLAIAWAGYDHLQLLQAIAAYFAEVQQLGGSDDSRLVPLLAAMDQQIPWVKQWHNDTDNEYGYALGDYFEEFIATEARNLSLTLEDVRAWEPPQKPRKKRASKKKVVKPATSPSEEPT